MANAFTAGGAQLSGGTREIELELGNLLNRTNFTRNSGVVTSPSFGRPTAAQPGRRLELGLRLVL